MKHARATMAAAVCGAAITAATALIAQSGNQRRAVTTRVTTTGQVCTLSWTFSGIGDKRYEGRGPTDKAASGAAVATCKRENFAVDEWKRTCDTTPKVRNCRPENGPTELPRPPAPELLACVDGPVPPNAIKGTTVELTTFRGRRDTGTSEFSVPLTAKRVKTWCHVRDDQGERLCRFGPKDRHKVCDYWFLPERTQMAWRKDHWDVWITFQNEHKKRTRYFTAYGIVE
jgi:hypothetical protein